MGELACCVAEVGLCFENWRGTRGNLGYLEVAWGLSGDSVNIVG